MKQEPPNPPWWSRAYWLVRAYITWPVEARRIKRMGGHRVGWMEWEL